MRNLSDFVVHREVDGQAVLLNLRTDTYLCLTGSGGRLWSLWAAHGNEEAVRRACAEFDVSSERIKRDLAELLRQVETLRADRARVRFRARRLPVARRLLEVPLKAWPSLLGTVFLAVVVEAGMRLLTLDRLARLAGMRLSFDRHEASGPVRDSRDGLTVRQQRGIWASERVYAVWPFGDTCLRRALVIGFHLRDEAPLLRIGVRAAPGESEGIVANPIAAHAWVETSAVTVLALPGYESLGGASPAPRSVSASGP